MAPARRKRRERPLASDEVATISFYGGASEVTGSCYLLRTSSARVLFECGMFQGGRAEERRNRRPFRFDPRALDAVVLTHAHIDHSGLLPKLVRDGFRGCIHATEGTRDLLEILLADSAHIHEQDARSATRRALRRGAKPVEPLYTTNDAERALRQVESHAFDRRFDAAPGVELRFRRAGHIIGASSVETWIRSGAGERSVVFSGDVGRVVDPMLLDPDPPQEADLVLLESTYGDRDHKDVQATLDELAAILNASETSDGNVIVPVFAVGRAQEILFHIAELERAGRIRPRPVYLDSPMAIHVSELYSRHAAELEADVRSAFEQHPDHLEPRHLSFCRTPDESIALNAKRGVIVLAGSGMCEAGRIVHHLRHNLWRPECRVLIAGFQARGTTGRALVDGARFVRILGESIAVRAGIHTLGGFSAHAGQSELLSWARGLCASGASFALVHGEPSKRAALAELLRERRTREVRLPNDRDEVALCGRGDPIRWRDDPRARPARSAGAAGQRE